MEHAETSDFVRYSKGDSFRSMLLSLCPISVLLYRNNTNNSLMVGSVVVTRQTWKLHPFNLNYQEQDELGFAISWCQCRSNIWI